MNQMSDNREQPPSVEETLAITRDLLRRSRATLDSLGHIRPREGDAVSGDDRLTDAPTIP